MGQSSKRTHPAGQNWSQFLSRHWGSTTTRLQFQWILYHDRPMAAMLVEYGWMDFTLRCYYPILSSYWMSLDLIIQDLLRILGDWRASGLVRWCESPGPAKVAYRQHWRTSTLPLSDPELGMAPTLSMSSLLKYPWQERWSWSVNTSLHKSYVPIHIIVYTYIII